MIITEQTQSKTYQINNEIFLRKFEVFKKLFKREMFLTAYNIYVD